MKNIYKEGLMMVLSIVSFCACTNEKETVDETFEEQTHSIRMSLNVSKTDFDATRATSDSWKDGDVIYLRFHTNNGVVTGNATYSATNQDWTVNYSGTLVRDKDMQVEVTHCSSLALSTKDIITLSDDIAIYQAVHGIYTYNTNNQLTINATLRPLTSRIRFKGEKKGFLNVGGLETYVAYNISNGTFTTTTDFVSRSVADDGYTSYIYGVIADSINPQIKINRSEDDTWDYLFTTDCEPQVMQVGKSGWISIPTTISHRGWTTKQVSGSTYKGEYTYDGETYNYEIWYDLGLPSGNKWAEDNIGADIAIYSASGNVEYIYGSYYYNTTCTWETPWETPTKADFEELVEYCSWEWVTDYLEDGVDGFLVSGSTGESIFLPAAGYKKNSSSSANREEPYGYYWANSTNTTYNYLYFYQGAEPTILSSSRRYYSIRPIIRP